MSHITWSKEDVHSMVEFINQEEGTSLKISDQEAEDIMYLVMEETIPYINDKIIDRIRETYGT